MSRQTHGEPDMRDKALDQFLDELVQDPDTPAPIGGELDAETIAWARRIVAAEQSQVPDAADSCAAQARVWTRVLASAKPRRNARPTNVILSGAKNLVPGKREPSPTSNHPRTTPGPAFLRLGLLAAGILLAIAISLGVWARQPAPVSAQEIIDKARASANSPAAGGVSSFMLTETRRSIMANPRMAAYSGLKQGDQITSETKRWYEDPNRWRAEYQQKTIGTDGKETAAYSSIQVSDGADIWQYDPGSNSVVVNQYDPRMNGKGGVSLFGEDAMSLNDLLQQASTCYSAKVTGSATIAGRATYVVDLGPTKCPSASGPEMNGQLVIWVDKETFFVLKQEQHSTEGNQIISTGEVTEIQYNISIDPALLKFTPPAGATVTDNRPKPAPTGDQFKQQLEQIAKLAEFPVLAPSYLPPGLAPKQPKIDPMMDNSVEISYFPTNEPDKDSMASMMKGLRVTEQRATNSLVGRWTESADPMSIGGYKSWLRRGVHNADGTGSDSAALVLRDGTLISVSSFTITPEELVKVSQSLQPVPGSHAPLPNPAPPTLAELRSRVSFPIFVPAFVPAGLTPEQPTGGEQPGENVTIKYHDTSGAVALTTTNGTPDCCPGLDMIEANVKTDHVTLANGIAAKLADMGPNAGGLYLWFEQDKRLISMNSTALTQDQMLKVAASLSKTADLGNVTEPPARPTATPLPPLKYTVLRPTWLPEPMTKREQRDGDTMILGFDPRPNDAPHDVLTLREMPKALVVPGGNPDPQEMHQQMGAHDVTIVKRGQDCITLTWTAGDRQLTLTNPYDPPGHPRYSCEQLAQIIESIK